MNRLDALEKLALAFPNANVKPETIVIYLEDLADIPDIVLAVALKKARQSSQFFPTIAQIRQSATEVVETQNPNRKKGWDEAWTEIMDALRHYSYLQVPPWSSPEVKQTVQGLGGWLSLCEMEEKNLGIVRAQGREIYKAILERKVKKEEVDQIIELHPNVKNALDQAVQKVLAKTTEVNRIEMQGQDRSKPTFENVDGEIFVKLPRGNS